MHDDVALRDVMTREFVGVSESDSLSGAARLMAEEGTASAVVLRGQEPVGLVSGREVVSFLADGGDPEATPVSEVMAPPPRRLTPDDSLAAAAAALADRDASELLVTDDGTVAGVLDARDVVAATATLPETGTVTAGPTDRQSGADRTGEYSSQSICEACGSLTRELVDVNGQLLCANCREV